MKTKFIYYALMILGAVLFAGADAAAEFDGDEDTKTATSWVRRFRDQGWGWALAAGFPIWLLLHFTWDDFPL